MENEETKTCSTCKLDKPRSAFYKDTRKGIKNDLRASCKECTSRSGIAYNERNREHQRARYRAFYQKNSDRILSANKQFTIDNKDWHREYNARRNRDKRRSDPAYRLRCNLSGVLRSIVRGLDNSGTKNGLVEIIGKKGSDLRNYLHSTFEATYGMPREWINLKEVEIDHIIPLSTAKTIEDVKRLNHYTNLQLLFKEDNRDKGTNLLDFSNQLV